MLFAQTSAPTGWTKDTTNYNNSALRVVTGSASTGGSVDFSTAFASQAVSGTVGSTTLTTSQIPSHSHSLAITADYSGSYAYVGNSNSSASASYITGYTGGGGSHNHSFSGTAINLAVKYVDVIRATKD
jgi:microcystin-dependent protein